MGRFVVLRVPYTQYGFLSRVVPGMFLELFLFAKKMKLLTDSLYFQVFPWHFYFMRGHSLVDLTEHDDSAADIIVHSMYIDVYCIHRSSI